MSGIDGNARGQAVDWPQSRAEVLRVDATRARFMRLWAGMMAQTLASVAHVVLELGQVPHEAVSGHRRERP